MATIDILPGQHGPIEAPMVVIGESRHASGALIRQVEVSDRYITDLEALERTTQSIEEQEKLARESSADTDLTTLFYNPKEKPALCQWYSFMGKGIALYNLQRPDTYTLGDGLENPYAAATIVDPEHYQHRVHQFDTYAATTIDDASRELFLYAADGRGIRNRAQVFKDVVSRHAAQQPGSEFEMLSVACGAALPAYEAAKEVIQQGGEPRLSLIDIDLAALNYAHQIAAREDLTESVDIRQLDLVSVFTGAVDLGRELSNTDDLKKFETIDLLGIFEYFDGEIAKEILKKMKEVTKPGGSIVFGNMLSTRPQMEFFKRYVGWRPEVQHRSISEILEIVNSAGFSLEDVTLSIPQDGVYAVVEISNVNL